MPATTGKAKETWTASQPHLRGGQRGHSLAGRLRVLRRGKEGPGLSPIPDPASTGQWHQIWLVLSGRSGNRRKGNNCPNS